MLSPSTTAALPVPIKARPPTSATRQQQKIRMIKQCCAVFNRHIPATENTWRPRKVGETHEAYRLRVVERGDGDMFRAWQIMETALASRTRLLFDALASRIPPEASRRALEDESAVVGVRDERGVQWKVCHCTECRMLVVRRGPGPGPAERERCDICATVSSENEQWAPHMPCKALSKKRKKKKKKRRPAAPAGGGAPRDRGAAGALPTPEELLQLAGAPPPPPAKRRRPGGEPEDRYGGSTLSLGIDTKPEQALRPTLQLQAVQRSNHACE